MDGTDGKDVKNIYGHSGLPVLPGQNNLNNTVSPVYNS